MKIKLCSWNIWGGQYSDQVIDYIMHHEADIICLQEVIEDLDGNNNIAKLIAKQLGYECVYAPTKQIETSFLFTKLQPKKATWGNAILSRYPIAEFKVHQLSEESPRTALEAFIPVHQKTLHVFSTHLIHTHQQDSALQDLQAKNLLAIMPKTDSLVMGDFNATPDSSCINIMNESLTNTDTELSAATWSVYAEGCPTCDPKTLDTRLDYIFATDDLKTKSFKVDVSKGSDHLPISVILNV
jgi:endonuclease/exonuclease/phosphatase family metal-dependent hydrolase